MGIAETMRQDQAEAGRRPASPQAPKLAYENAYSRKLFVCTLASMEAPAVLSPAPDTLARIQALVLDSVPSPFTKRAYGQALAAFLAWYAAEQPGPLSKAVVQRYRVTLDGKLSPSSVN